MAYAKFELGQLNEKLSNTTTVVKFAGRDYIKITGSVMEFNGSFKTMEKDKYGNYAAVWYRYEKEKR